MAFTYDLSTSIGKVRRKIADTDAGLYSFEDAEVQSALDEHSDSLNRAAADLLRTLAVDRVKLDKRVKALDGEVDRKGIVNNLLAAAKALDEADADAGGFAIASTVGNFFGKRERLRKEIERNGE